MGLGVLPKKALYLFHRDQYVPKGSAGAKDTTLNGPADRCRVDAEGIGGLRDFQGLPGCYSIISFLHVTRQPTDNLWTFRDLQAHPARTRGEVYRDVGIEVPTLVRVKQA